MNETRVLWNNQERTVASRSESQLTVSILAGDVAAAGSATVSVVNPPDDQGQGGGSASLTFSIAIACSYSIFPSTQSFAPGTGSGTVSVTAGNGCSWTASSQASWVTITSGASGSGNGTVGYSVAANPGRTSRSGSVTIAGQAFEVRQAGTCSFTFEPATASAPVGGGTGSIRVIQADGGCGWRATSSSSWLTITSGNQGAGAGTITFGFPANSTGATRTGTITIEDQVVQVVQAGPTVLTLELPALTATDGLGNRLDDSRHTGIALVNLGSSSTAVLTLTALDTAGAVITGTDVRNPATLALASGQQSALLVTEIFGRGISTRNSVGRVSVESSASGVLGFFLQFNESLSVLDGADISPATAGSFVLPEVEDQGYTEIHLANPKPAPATVAIDLVKSDGSLRTASVNRTIRPTGILAEPLSSLFPGIAPDSGDYVRIRSNDTLSALELLGAGTEYVEMLNGQDSSGGASSLYSPQYATGSGWRSTLSVVNLSAAPGTVTFEWIGEDGLPIGSTQTRQIAAGGKIYVSSQDFFGNFGGALRQGYVKITGNGLRLAGSVVFGDPSRAKFASALPLTANLQSSIVLAQVATDTKWFTGVAILNPNDVFVSARIIVRDSNGRVLAERTENLGPRQRKSALLTQYFPELVGRSILTGYIQVISSGRIVGFGLYGTGDLSVLSAVPPQAAPQ